MDRKETNKIIYVLIGTLLFMGIFWLVMQRLEEVIPDQTVESKAAFLEEPLVTPTATPQVRGTLKLDGKKYDYTDEISTYLFMGIDMSGSLADGQNEYHGGMADFLLLAVLDKTTKTYGFLQLDRDTITEITLMQTDGSGYASARMQLCTAHWYGGNEEQSCENTVDAVSDLLGGVEIDGYYALGMEEITTLNHAVGGVSVTIDSDFSKVDPSLQEGETVVLTDEQAYTFLHDRYGVDDETNTSRMQRQRQYMESLFLTVQNRMEENAGFVNELYQSLESVAVSNITGKTVSKIVNQINESESQGMQILAGESRIGQRLDDGVDHVEFYPDPDSVCEVLTELYHLVERSQ